MSSKSLLKRWFSPKKSTLVNRRPAARTRLELEQLEDRTVLSPVVSVVASTPLAYENGSQAGAFTISRTGDTSSTLGVMYQMSGTATNGTDYTNLQGMAMIQAGQSSIVINVNATMDQPGEGNETAILTIVSMPMPGMYTIGNPGSATVTIVDWVPTVTINATDANASEVGPDPGVFTLTRDSTLGALTVNYSVSGTATNGTDYALTGSASFTAGSATTTLQVMPMMDALVEGPETVQISILSGSGYNVGSPNAATVTIADAPPPTVTIAATDASASEVGPDPGTFTLTRTGSTMTSLTVSYSVSGSASGGNDYMALSGTATFAVGSSTATIQLTPQADGLVEGNETVQVTLQSGAGYGLGSSTSATVTIADTPAPTVTVQATAAHAFEQGTTAGLPGAFTFSRAGSTQFDLQVFFTLSGTATQGADYSTPPGSIIIPAGAASMMVPIVPIADGSPEFDETVVASISSTGNYVVGGSSSGTIIVSDNPYDIYINTVTPASQTYSSAVNAALQIYQYTFNSVVASAQSSVAGSYALYQSTVSTAYQQFLSDIATAYSAYQAAVDSANTARDAAGNQAFLAYTTSMDAAKSANLAAVDAASAAYTASTATAAGTYNAAVEPYELALDAANAALVSAQTNFANAEAVLAQTIATASAVQTAAQNLAYTNYQAALNLAATNFAADQAAANTVYQSALVATDAAYNAFVNPYQLARDQAFAYYQANPNDPAAETAYNNAATVLTNAIATATGDRTAAQTAAFSALQNSLAQANQVLVDAQNSASQDYQAALATAAANYAATVAPVQTARDQAAIALQNAQSALTLAQSDLDNAMATAASIGDAAIAAAETQFNAAVDQADAVLIAAQANAQTTYLGAIDSANSVWAAAENAAWSALGSQQGTVLATFINNEGVAWNSFLTTVSNEQANLVSTILAARNLFDQSTSAALIQWQSVEQTAWGTYSSVVANNPGLPLGQRMAAPPPVAAPDGQAPVLPIGPRDPGMMLAMAGQVAMARLPATLIAPVVLAQAPPLQGITILVTSFLATDVFRGRCRTVVMAHIASTNFGAHTFVQTPNAQLLEESGQRTRLRTAVAREVARLTAAGNTGITTVDAAMAGVVANVEYVVQNFPNPTRSGNVDVRVMFEVTIRSTTPAGAAATSVIRFAATTIFFHDTLQNREGLRAPPP